MSEPWYQAGLQFTCTRCGNCCTGEPGNVWVSPEELQAIANELDEPLEEVQAVYTRSAKRGISLREKSNGDCVFFDREQGCTIYDQRPAQCRTWPFWESNVQTPQAWEEACKECPGAGQGDLITVEEIIARARQVIL